MAAGTAAAPAPAATLEGTVSRVVDGDTIHVTVRGFDDTIRLVGIDTPETKRPGTVVECGGPAASAAMARLLPPGRRVRLVTDPTQATRDRYGRLLAYVYAPGRGGLDSVGYRLVSAGYAKVDVYEGRPFRYAGPYLLAASRARRAGRGLWGPPCNGNTLKADPSVSRPVVSRPGGETPARGPVPGNLYNCSDFPLPDGTTARQYLRRYPSDPSRLDGDHDGVACEGG